MSPCQTGFSWEEMNYFYVQNLKTLRINMKYRFFLQALHYSALAAFPLLSQSSLRPSQASCFPTVTFSAQQSQFRPSWPANFCHLFLFSQVGLNSVRRDAKVDKGFYKLVSLSTSWLFKLLCLWYLGVRTRSGYCLRFFNIEQKWYLVLNTNTWSITAY